jgi:hypothetical protein
MRRTVLRAIECAEYDASSTPGVFVAGNILKDEQLSIVAASEGARSDFGINKALTREDFTRLVQTRKQVERTPAP